MVAKANPPTPGSKYRIRIGQTIAGLVWSNVAYTVDGKWEIIYDDGEPDLWPISQSASGSSRAAVLWTTNQVAKKNGWVVGGLVFGGSTSQRGQSYVQAFVLDASSVAASTISDYLCMGYAYASKPVEFGTFVEPGPAGGHGHFRELTTADPAANAEVAGTVPTCPTGAKWKLLTYTVQLVQGITQTPLPTLRKTGANGVEWQIPITTTAIGASSTAQLTWGLGLVQSSFTAVVGDEFHTAPIPLSYLDPTEFVATVTDGIGANTNYGAAIVVVEEWVIPN